jgi:hypothetical protein
MRRGEPAGGSRGARARLALDRAHAPQAVAHEIGDDVANKRPALRVSRGVRDTAPVPQCDGELRAARSRGGGDGANDSLRTHGRSNRSIDGRRTGRDPAGERIRRICSGQAHRRSVAQQVAS